jgi:SAM-dependent methyltransferase
VKISTIDNGNNFDWGKTSDDYSRYRPGYPDSFFDLLSALGIGVPDQRILDLGTGTGVLARGFAKKGARVTGVDISPGQIGAAIALSEQSSLDIKFIVSPAEDIDFKPNSFDVISSGQSWIYFNHAILIEKLKSIASNGKLVLTHLNWLPFQDAIAHETEKLVLKFNPVWQGAGYCKAEPYMFESLNQLELLTFHKYTTALPFSRECWMGRIRACRGVGAFLSKEQVVEFDKEHSNLLSKIADEQFTILHEISVHVFKIA